MKKIPQIFTTIDAQDVPVAPGVIDAIEQEELRECVRDLLKEQGQYYAKDPEKRMVWRGMKIDMGSAKLASVIRKTCRVWGDENTGMSRREARDFILAKCEGNCGGSWSTAWNVAVSFADVWGVERNAGKTLHVIIQATIDQDTGYDPQAAGEEPMIFYDEGEVRIKADTPIPITGVFIYFKSKDKWAKPSSPLQWCAMWRDYKEDSPIIMKA